jgi:hypothetical protein
MLSSCASERHVGTGARAAPGAVGFKPSHWPELVVHMGVVVVQDLNQYCPQRPHAGAAVLGSSGPRRAAADAYEWVPHFPSRAATVPHPYPFTPS